MDQYFTQAPEELEQFLDFMEDDLENVRRVIEAVKDNGVDAEFMVHAKAETVQESADNTDMDRSGIVKTLVFIAREPVAVLCPGHMRVSEQKLSDLTGVQVRMADPGEVLEATGYHVGGVSPFDLGIPVYMEESILDQERVKPAAGSRVVGVTLAPDDLRDVTGAEVVEIGEK